MLNEPYNTTNKNSPNLNLPVFEMDTLDQKKKKISPKQLEKPKQICFL